MRLFVREVKLWKSHQNVTVWTVTLVLFLSVYIFQPINIRTRIKISTLTTIYYSAVDGGSSRLSLCFDGLFTWLNQGKV